MKIRTPHYYKDFKCIAGDCTDTCCAGWEVDVDEKSYQYYQQVEGDFGRRLKEVMVPSGEGGCTFTLKEGRCPFLNGENLCDLYTVLGEEHLCETCAEFPRFVNEYGSVREIGIAPSCKTAGALIFNCEEKLTFDETEDGRPVAAYNEIDAGLYLQLVRAQKTAYHIAQEEQFSIEERCILLLELAQQIQRHMDREQDERIGRAAEAFMDLSYCRKRIDRCRTLYGGTDAAYTTIPSYFAPFKGMEVINADWLRYCEIHEKFLKSCAQQGGVEAFRKKLKIFQEDYKTRLFEYRQLLVYYIFRYFLDAVYDYNILLKIKNALVGYIVLLQMDAAVWYNNDGKLSKTEQIDIAHLYSRQFEHSYTNFEQYSLFFEKKRCYSVTNLKRILTF